jgi:hypothetical protein
MKRARPSLSSSRPHLRLLVVGLALLACPAFSCPLFPPRPGAQATIAPPHKAAPILTPAQAQTPSPTLLAHSGGTPPPSPTPTSQRDTLTPTRTLEPPTPVPSRERPAPTATRALPTAPGARPEAPSLPRPSTGQQPGVPLLLSNPFLSLLPELQSAEGPQWLQPGLRVTYRAQTASIPQAQDEESISGAGYVQYDVVALDGALVVCHLQFYLEVAGGAGLPSASAPSYGSPGSGDFWLDPAALASAEQAASDRLKVARLPLTVAGRQYDAVRFEYRPEDAEYVWMFDADSGLLLFYRHAIGGEHADRRELAEMTLLRTRELPAPWAQGSLPTWVQEGAKIRLQGPYTVAIPGSPGTALPYELTVSVKQVGSNWAEFGLAGYLSGQLSSSYSQVTGAWQLGGRLWLPPGTSAPAQPQLLDEDPVTGEKVSLGRGPNGTIALVQAGPAHRSTIYFELRTGRPIAAELHTTVGLAKVTVELAARGQQ